ncbi:MAG: ABC transporter permease [Chloroflexota bacterium]|nr:ABC transporter permease [Chloroflexota bacterium]
MTTTADSPVLAARADMPMAPGGVRHWPRGISRFCRRKPLGAVGAIIVITMILVAIFVDAALFGNSRPLLAPDGYNHQHIRNVDQAMSWSHPMGTDELGRDIFSRILYGARISAVIGFSAVAIVVLISLVLGTVSAYFSGWVDTAIQRVIDVILSIPAVVLLIFSISVFAGRSGPYGRMFWIIVIVGFILSAANVRVIRGAAIATMNNQYVDAARTIGAANSRIIFRHIVPNVIPVAIVLATVNLGTAILAEAAISFLGYGIPPPFPSWGAMLNISGSSQFRAHPIQAVWPGLAIAFAVYGFNVLGDAMRDVLDPRLRGGR